MMTKTNSLQRVLTTLGFNEPDRVPLFLLLTMHGAKELNLSIEDYFSKAENVVEGQLRLMKKYRNDCIYTFFYASIEVEAMGGEVIYSSDGPPNAGRPVIEDIKQINSLKPIYVNDSDCLKKVLKATQLLKAEVGDKVPIIGVAMSPFSVPVMQLGFSGYLDLMYEHPDLFDKLMQVNEAFCVDWANAQLEAGATAICYFDPLSSSTVLPREKFLKTGFEIGKRTISKINGPVALHLASGISLPIADELTKMGAAVLGVSGDEDLAELKSTYFKKINLLGNLNGIEMRRWSAAEAELKVKEAIKKAAKGGGFILSDNHGEIPYQVTDEVLMAISNAVQKWGNYPIKF